MIPLGQFRDTFIIAIDDEGMAIIDQHVAHERVLFERVMERLTAGRLESQRLLVPMIARARAVGAPGAGRARRRARAARLRDRGLRRGDDQGHRRAGAAEDRGLREGAARAGRRSRRAGPRRARAGRAAADCGDDGVPCGREGELPADLREDGAHPRRAARDGVLDRLSARPPRDAAAHAPRDREELRSHDEPARSTISAASDSSSACGCCSWMSSRRGRSGPTPACLPSASRCSSPAGV